MITEEQLKKFKRLYKEHFGKDISDADALESATSLINLVRAVYKPITKSEFDTFSQSMANTAGEAKKS